jgi:hypothetical protein
MLPTLYPCALALVACVVQKAAASVVKSVLMSNLFFMAIVQKLLLIKLIKMSGCD